MCGRRATRRQVRAGPRPSPPRSGCRSRPAQRPRRSPAHRTRSRRPGPRRAADRHRGRLLDVVDAQRDIALLGLSVVWMGRIGGSNRCVEPRFGTGLSGATPASVATWAAQAPAVPSSSGARKRRSPAITVQPRPRARSRCWPALGVRRRRPPDSPLPRGAAQRTAPRLQRAAPYGSGRLDLSCPIPIRAAPKPGPAGRYADERASAGERRATPLI